MKRDTYTRKSSDRSGRRPRSRKRSEPRHMETGRGVLEEQGDRVQVTLPPGVTLEMLRSGQRGPAKEPVERVDQRDDLQEMRRSGDEARGFSDEEADLSPRETYHAPHPRERRSHRRKTKKKPTFVETTHQKVHTSLDPTSGKTVKRVSRLASYNDGDREIQSNGRLRDYYATKDTATERWDGAPSSSFYQRLVSIPAVEGSQWRRGTQWGPLGDFDEVNMSYVSSNDDRANVLQRQGLHRPAGPLGHAYPTEEDDGFGVTRPRRVKKLSKIKKGTRSSSSAEEDVAATQVVTTFDEDDSFATRDRIAGDNEEYEKVLKSLDDPNRLAVPDDIKCVEETEAKEPPIPKTPTGISLKTIAKLPRKAKGKKPKRRGGRASAHDDGGWDSPQRSRNSRGSRSGRRSGGERARPHGGVDEMGKRRKFKSVEWPLLIDTLLILPSACKPVYDLKKISDGFGSSKVSKENYEIDSLGNIVTDRAYTYNVEVVKDAIVSLEKIIEEHGPVEELKMVISGDSDGVVGTPAIGDTDQEQISVTVPVKKPLSVNGIPAIRKIVCMPSLIQLKNREPPYGFGVVISDAKPLPIRTCMFHKEGFHYGTLAVRIPTRCEHKNYSSYMTKDGKSLMEVLENMSGKEILDRMLQSDETPAMNRFVCKGGSYVGVYQTYTKDKEWLPDLFVITQCNDREASLKLYEHFKVLEQESKGITRESKGFIFGTGRDDTVAADCAIKFDDEDDDDDSAWGEENDGGEATVPIPPIDIPVGPIPDPEAGTRLWGDEIFNSRGNFLLNEVEEACQLARLAVVSELLSLFGISISPAKIRSTAEPLVETITGWFFADTSSEKKWVYAGPGCTFLDASSPGVVVNENPWKGPVILCGPKGDYTSSMGTLIGGDGMAELQTKRETDLMEMASSTAFLPKKTRQERLVNRRKKGIKLEDLGMPWFANEASGRLFPVNTGRMLAEKALEELYERIKDDPELEELFLQHHENIGYVGIHEDKKEGTLHPRLTTPCYREKSDFYSTREEMCGYKHHWGRIDCLPLAVRIAPQVKRDHVLGVW